MTYTIRMMTKTDSGYNLSGDIAADLLAGKNGMPDYGDPLESAMSDLGYALDNSGDFAGWGDVYFNEEGDLLSVELN